MNGFCVCGLPHGSATKNPPARQEPQEMQVWSLGWEDPLEEGMATHSSVIASRISWTEKTDGLQSIGSQSQTWLNQLSTHACICVYICMLSHFSCVQLSATPWAMDHQAPRSMGFSRQEYRSGLPFPSPVMKYEVSEVKWNHSVMSDSLQPHGLQPTRFPCPWDFPGKSTRVGCHCFLQSVYRHIHIYIYIYILYYILTINC